ncbi:hypothetical protein SeLEV6574_g03367 [Synchytrium endobioticum]|uniref:Glutathione transferase n=1 Tax=Synchytrium endobioticum TaxID=286115 RepID=A0A507D3W2_9FUNG|nr:hypothetical protein SeLEV6574_g03367 [Synchytrium endobioticum]
MAEPMAKPANLDTGLHLFWGSGSPYARRVQMAIIEKGLPACTHRMDFGRGDTRTLWFKDLNPRHKVPTLVHDGVMVNESLAILEYLERQFPHATPLLSTDRKLQARALSLSHESDSLGKVNSELTARTIFAKQGQYTGEQVGESAQKVYDELDAWESHLKDNASQYKAGWLVGNEISIADISLYPYISNYATRLGLKLSPRYQLLDKWLSQINERPSAKQSEPPHWKDSPAPTSPFK